MHVSSMYNYTLFWFAVLFSLVLGNSAFAQTSQFPVAIAAAVGGFVFKSAERGCLGQRLRSGAPIYEGVCITTGSAGRMHLLLTDQSVFTMGPRSSMVMDVDSYKPKTQR